MKLHEDAQVLVTVDCGVLLVIAGDGETVYGAEDWRDLASPSFAFDSDGDLRRHNGERCYGPAIEYREGTLEELLLAWGDIAVDTVLP